MHLEYAITEKRHPSSAAARGRPGARRPSARLLRNGRPRSRIWTDHALMQLPKNGYKYELLEGTLIMSPAGFSHGGICASIIIALGNFVYPRKLGKIYDGQTGFRLTRGFQRKTVLSPDVSFVRRAR